MTNTTTNARKTKRQYYSDIVRILKEVNRPDLVEVIMHEVDLMNKHTTSKKKTAKQEQNAIIMDNIMAVLSEMSTPICMKDLLLLDDDRLKDITSNQHLNSLMIKLVEAGRVTKEYIKKTAYFSAVKEEVSANDD